MKTALVALICAFPVAPVFSQGAGIPRCVSVPDDVTLKAIVLGFPGQRLYLNPKHLRECAEPGAQECKSTAYLVSGDQLDAGNDCDGETYVSYQGSTKLSKGWVATRRIAVERENSVRYELEPEAPRKDQEALQVRLPRACSEASSLLNRAVRQGKPLQSALPTALETKRTPFDDDLHKDLLPEYVGSQGFADAVKINGQKIMAVQYTTEGTCYDVHYALLSADLSKALNKELADGLGNYSEETIVVIGGAPHLARIHRAERAVDIYAFEKDFSASAVCSVVQVAPNREQLRSAADPAVCKAALDGTVEDPALQDIRPFGLTSETLRQAVGTSDFGRTSGTVLMVAQGTVDVDNDQQDDHLGMLQYDGDSGAGCGWEFHKQWPVVLDANGMPDGRSLVNRQLFENAGSDDISRLFRFRGATYFEHHSLPSADTASHEIWKFTPEGPAKICDFNPVRYELRDTVDE